MNALGCLYLDQGKLDQAERLFTEALAIKPQWTDLHLNHGRVLEKRGEDHEALAEFRKAVETGPVSPYARLYLAQALVSQGDDSAGEPEFRKSLEFGQTLAAQHGLVNLLLRESRLQEAETLLRQISAEYPYDLASHLQLGRLLDKSSKSEEAIKEYQAVLESDPRNKEAQDAIKRMSAP
jgi:Tfp pilus assembly protein PilF